MPLDPNRFTRKTGEALQAAQTEARVRREHRRDLVPVSKAVVRVQRRR